MENVIGDSLKAITDQGSISTGACYSELSKFFTLKGSLNLQNVHKVSEVVALNCDYVNMTGFYGTLQARLNGGKLNFQLSELNGDSFIYATNAESFVANISEMVEQQTCLSITADNITLDSSLNEFNAQRSNDNGLHTLKSGDPDKTPHRLSIQTNSKLQLGKLSWMEAMCKKFAAATEEKI